MFKKIYTMLAATVAVFLIATAVYVTLTSFSNPAMKPVLTGERIEPLIKSTTTIRQESKYAACGDVEVYYRGPAKRDLIGLDENRLRLKYPRQEGWTVAVEGDEVVITRQLDGLCGAHREYRHLGIHEGQLAVYQGPLGHDEVLLRVESGININRLPESFLDKLNKVDTFADLYTDEQLELRNAIEFTDEQALNALLENFDEYGDS